jgi:CDP-diacylglycerol--glycerol-3-phosphate 3-phosphatidyltransferase/cardiolipin synthase
LISFLRLPLAASFPFVCHSVWGSLVVLGMAAVTDVLDGWVARRFKLATPTGAVVDGVADKAFVAVVLGTLIVTGIMPWTHVLLLGARELGELPLLGFLALSHEARSRKVEDRANLFGKAATVLQFAAIVGAILRSPARATLVYATVIVGAAAAVSYWVRTLSAARTARAKSGGES